MSRLNDISQKRFGKLIALCRDGVDSTGKTKWCCKCDCGNKTSATMLNLTHGVTKSCGCLKRGPSARRLTLIGKRFGYLTVIAVDKYRNNRLKWKCKCDCGNIVYVCAQSLVRGKSKSCGCYREEVRGYAFKSKTEFAKSRWAKIVKSNAVCSKCSTKLKLEAHHIIPVGVNPTLVGQISNGAVLCQSCHKSFHSKYGHASSLKDFGKFLGMHTLSIDALECFVGHRSKGGRQDLLKAIHFLQLLLELEYPLQKTDAFHRTGEISLT